MNIQIYIDLDNPIFEKDRDEEIEKLLHDLIKLMRHHDFEHHQYVKTARNGLTGAKASIRS